MPNFDCQFVCLHSKRGNFFKVGCSLVKRIVVSFVLVFGIAASSWAEDPVTLRQDRLFINQLVRRHFFDLARHHCSQQQIAATTSDGKAVWQLRLSEVYEEQAWFSASESRNGLLNHAAEQITDLLNSDRPSPEYEFLLRIQQVSLLSQAVRMELVVLEGGHLFGRSVRPTPQNDSQLSNDKLRIVTLENSLELIEVLLRQLQQLRRDLDPQLVRRIRELARLEKAELLVLQFRLQRGRNQAEDDLKQTAKKAVDDASRLTDRVTKANGRLLSAELALASGDREEFQLRVRSVQPDEAPQDFHPSFLTARSMLMHQESTQALRVLELVAPVTALQRQQLEWLRLECHLGIRELAGELQDFDFVATSKQDFELKLAAAGKVLKGVFRDAAERTAERFHLVNAVGVEVADLVEQVEFYKLSNQPQKALQLIEQALRKTSPDSLLAIAALKLRAGEIRVENQAWSAAQLTLTQAADLFQQLELKKEHSAADLLRIYVLAQQLKSDPAATRQNYVLALEKHVDAFPDQASCSVAMRWLFDVLQSSDAVGAANLGLQLFRQETNPRKKITDLERLGGLLLRADLSPKVQKLVAEFRSEFEKLVGDSGLYPSIDLVVLRQQVLEFQFADSVAKEDTLRQHASTLAEIRRDLNRAGHLSVDTISELQRRCDLLEVVLTARSVRSSQEIEGVELRMMQTEPDQLMDTIQFLRRQHQHGKVLAGDVWLASINERLLSRILTEAPPESLMNSLISFLPAVREANALTNDNWLLDQWVESLLSQQLSRNQTIQVATELSAGASGSKSSQSLAHFWQKIAGMNRQGSDLWLESQLQLAEISHESGKVEAARQRVGVVSTLYPDWGSAERKKKADALLNAKLNP